MLTILVPQLRLLVKCQQRVRDILQPRQQHGRAGSAAALDAVTSCCSPDIGRAARTVASAVVQLAQCHGTSAQASSCCAGGCELRAALAWAAARAVGVASRTNCAAAAMQNAARLRSSSQWPNCAHMLTATLPADSWTCSPKSPKSADEAAAAIGRVSPQRAAARSNTALHQEEEVVTGKERPSAQRTSREEPSSLSEQRHVLASTLQFESCFEISIASSQACRPSSLAATRPKHAASSCNSCSTRVVMLTTIGRQCDRVRRRKRLPAAARSPLSTAGRLAPRLNITSNEARRGRPH